MRLQLSPASLEDLARARDHYEVEREGLGQEFLDEIERLAERIAELPLQFAAIPGSSARRGLCKRFPYMIVFLVLDDHVRVIAVLHQHQHPDTWLTRS